MKKLITLIALGWSFLTIAGNSYTNVYNSLMKKDLILNIQDLKQLEDKKIILVPGLMAEAFLSDDTRSPINLGDITDDYFGAQLRYFEELGLDVERLTTNSRSPQGNKNNVKDLIERAHRENQKIIFITHSMGGNALHQAMIEIHKNGEKNKLDSISGIIFLQSPLKGSEVADFVHSQALIRHTITDLIPFMGGDIDSINYLRTSVRGKFLEDNRKLFLEITKSIPILSIATVAPFITGLDAPRKIINLRCGGCPNDGLVSVESALALDGDYIYLTDIDHAASIMKAIHNIERGKATAAFLKILLSK